MARATIMDAFNAANHFTEQTLGYIDEEKREKADAWLRNVPASFYTDMENHKRDHPFNYTGDPDNEKELNEYTERYNAELNIYADEWFRKKANEHGKFFFWKKDKNGQKVKVVSPYVIRNIDQMKTQAKEANRNLAYGKQDEYRIQNEYINFDKNSQKALEGVKNGTLTLQQGVEMINNNIEYLGTQDEISAQKKNKMRTAYETAAYKEYALSEMGQVHDVKDLPDAMERVRAAAAELPKRKIYTYDKDGNVTGKVMYKTQGENGNEIETEEHPWSFEGKDEWEKALIQQETNRIHKHKKEQILIEDARYRSMMEEGIRTGQTTLMLRANLIADEYRSGIQKELRDGKNNIEYADSDKDMILGLFKPYDDKSGSGWGKDKIIDYLKTFFTEMRKEYGQGGVQHKNGMTYEQAAAEFEDLYLRVTKAYGFDRATADLWFGRTVKLDEFMGDFKDFIRDIDPDFNTEVINGVNAAVKHIAKNAKLNDDAQEMLIRQVGREIFNTVADMGLGILTHEEWIEKAKGMATRAVAGEIALMDIKNKESVKNLEGFWGTENQIKIIEQAKENPDSIGFYNGKVHFIGNEENLNTFKEFTERDISKVLGIDRNLAEATGWAEEEGRQDDIIGIPLITVKGSDGKDGTYKQDVVTEKNNGKETKKVVTLKLNKETNKWEEVSRSSGAQSLSESKKQNDNKLLEMNIQKMVNNQADIILSKPSASARRAEWDGLQGNFTEWERLIDEILMRGIDPETLEPIKNKISREKIDGLKKRHPDQLERINNLPVEEPQDRRPGRGK